MEVIFITQEEASDLYNKSHADTGESELNGELFKKINALNCELTKEIVASELLVPFLEIVLQIIRARLRGAEDRYSYQLCELEAAIIYFAKTLAEFQALPNDCSDGTKEWYQANMDAESAEIAAALIRLLPDVFKNEF